MRLTVALASLAALLATPAAAGDIMEIVMECREPGYRWCTMEHSVWHTTGWNMSWAIDATAGCHKTKIPFWTPCPPDDLGRHCPTDGSPPRLNFCIDWDKRRGHYWWAHGDRGEHAVSGPICMQEKKRSVEYAGCDGQLCQRQWWHEVECTWSTG